VTAADRARLAAQIADARRLLAAPVEGPADQLRWAYRCGQLEATLKLVCDSAEAVAAAGGSR
jgi:hypothetical protein